MTSSKNDRDYPVHFTKQGSDIEMQECHKTVSFNFSHFYFREQIYGLAVCYRDILKQNCHPCTNAFFG